MTDTTFNHAEQYRLESFVEQVAGQTAADIAHFERIGETSLADGKRLFLEQIRMVRDLLADKGVAKRAPIAPRSFSTIGAAAVRDIFETPRAAPIDLDHIVKSDAAP